MFFPQRNHFLMLPWVILGFMLIISLVISIIYTTVVFFIDGYILAGVLWIIIGTICVCEYICGMWKATANKLIANFCSESIFSGLSVYVGRCLQPFHRDKRRTATWKIQPSAVQKINYSFDWHLCKMHLFLLIHKSCTIFKLRIQWLLKMLLMKHQKQSNTHQHESPINPIFFFWSNNKNVVVHRAPVY